MKRAGKSLPAPATTTAVASSVAMGEHHAVVTVRGTVDGPTISTAVAISGRPASAQATVTTDAPWLSARIVDAPSHNEPSHLDLACAPSSLNRGMYKGTVSIQSGSETSSYQVIFIVTETRTAMLK